jgi:hypothetical protein
VVVIGAFMAAIIGSERSGNYGRLKRGRELLGATVGGSMAWEKEGAVRMARQSERRSRRGEGGRKVRWAVWAKRSNMLAGGWADWFKI